MGFVWKLEDLFLELRLVLCVGGCTTAFSSQVLDFRAIGGDSFDVIASWFVAVMSEPLDTEDVSTILELFLCFVAA